MADDKPVNDFGDEKFYFFKSEMNTLDRVYERCGYEMVGFLTLAVLHKVFDGVDADLDGDRWIVGAYYDAMVRAMGYSLNQLNAKRKAQKKSVESRRANKSANSRKNSANSRNESANCEEKRTERNGREEKFSSGSGRSGDAPEGAPLPALSDEEFAKLSLDEMNKYADADLTSEQVRIRGRERLWAYNDELEERDRLGL